MCSYCQVSLSSCMQLISSKIIPATQNVFWDDLPEPWQQLTPLSCLAITTELAEGSAANETLLKMLSACKLSADQYHILTFNEGQNIAWHKLKTLLQPKQVILLGIHPQQLGIQALFRMHQPNSYNDCLFIPSLSLEELDASPQAKKDFWVNGLKPVFLP